MTRIVNKKGIKKLLAANGIKAGPNTVEKMAKREEKRIAEHIEWLSRKVKITGRKVLKESDIE